MVKHVQSTKATPKTPPDISRRASSSRSPIRSATRSARGFPHMPIPSRGRDGMRCKCGYSFSRGMTKKKRGYESFAVVSDSSYQTFLQSEIKVLRARTDHTKLRAILDSSQFVGTLFECPKCSRLLLLKPPASSSEDELEFYVKEN